MTTPTQRRRLSVSVLLFVCCLVPAVARAEPPDAHAATCRYGCFYVARHGDFVNKVAHALGIDPGALWNHPDNAELKSRRDPNLLRPGDVLHVPPSARLGETRVASTAGSGKHGHTTFITLNFSDSANVAYTVEGLATKVSGITDARGAVCVEIPVELDHYRISFPTKGTIYPVIVGMDPVTEPAGARRRLQHLGFRVPPTEHEDMDERDRAATAAFQRAHELPATGVLDEATRAALVTAHGS